MKKTIIIVSIIVVVAILGFVAYSLSISKKVPQTFIDKHNEKVALEKEVAQVSDLNNLPEWNDFNTQMGVNNYADASKSIVVALSKKEEASAKLDAINIKLSELESISKEITDSEVKTSADNFIEIAKKDNSAKITYNDLQIQMIKELKTMVDILAINSEAISAEDEKIINDASDAINGLKTQIDEAENELNIIQSQYVIIEKDFFELIGLEAVE
ncbi:MAG: hypothetical protein Q8P20_10105 [bacterium]|nr:hypothetical protein [bacterium]